MKKDKPSQVSTRTLKEATAQQVFDHIALHLLKQNKKAKVSENSACRYRVEVCGEVLKCAAGSLIPDEDYNLSMENQSWSLNTLRRYGISTNHNELIKSLQGIHDWVEVSNWKPRLKAVGELYNLNTDVLNYDSNTL